MVWLHGGQVSLGSDQGYAEARPVRSVTLNGFWIDRTEVTHRQLEALARFTGYVTEAECQGAGVAFRAPREGEDIAYDGWWHLVQGENWRHPDGPDGKLPSQPYQPVMQVTRRDAQACSRPRNAAC